MLYRIPKDLEQMHTIGSYSMKKVSHSLKNMQWQKVGCQVMVSRIEIRKLQT